MSLFGNISMLGSAMRSFQYGLDVASNNVANAGTLGYSRQVLGLSPLMPIQDANFLVGSGVTAGSITRVRDIFLDSRIKFELAELGRASIRNTALTELAAIFPEVANAASTAGLKGAIDNVATTWTALAAAPTSVGAQTAVRDALKAVADLLQSDARKVFDLQVKLDDQVKTTVAEINNLTQTIADMNVQIRIAQSKASGGSPGVLLDLREQAAEKLAKLIDANFTVIGDGSMVVTFNGGVLADGTQAKHLALINSSTDPGRTGIGYYKTPLGTPTNVTRQILGGKLGGLLQARDTDVEKARQDLNRMAFGIISRSNEINQTFVAGDATTNHKLFIGTTAADIALDPIINGNPTYVGGSRGLGAGDLALMQAQIKNFIQFSSMRTATTGNISGGGPAIDPTVALGAQVFASAPSATAIPGSGQMVISTGGNSITVPWDTTQSIDDIIQYINGNSSGAFYATFDITSQKFILTGQTPLTVYDVSANLADVFMISSVVTSSAPINNYPVPGATATLQVDPFTGMNVGGNILNLYTSPSPQGGTILIDGQAMNWMPTDDIGATLFLAAQGTLAPPAQVNLFFDAATQTVYLERSGDPTGANAGSHSYPAATMDGIQIVDQSGNLTRVLNLDTNTNASKILDELIVSLGSRQSTQSVLEIQAQALVDQTQQLQDNVSKVDLNYELAQARLYQRSYEASVRLQAIMDEMLNVLINRTGTASSASSSV